MQQHQYKTTGGSFNIEVVMFISPKSVFRTGQVSTAPCLPRVQLTLQSNTSADCSVCSTKEKKRWEGQVHGNAEHEPCFGSGLLGRKQTFLRSQRVQSWPIGKLVGGSSSHFSQSAAATLLHTRLPTERVHIGPHSRLVILMPDRASASADISFKEPQCIAVHSSEGPKSFLPYWCWTAAMCHKQQVEAHS